MRKGFSDSAWFQLSDQLQGQTEEQLCDGQVWLTVSSLLWFGIRWAVEAEIKEIIEEQLGEDGGNFSL